MEVSGAVDDVVVVGDVGDGEGDLAIANIVLVRALLEVLLQLHIAGDGARQGGGVAGDVSENNDILMIKKKCLNIRQKLGTRNVLKN